MSTGLSLDATPAEQAAAAAAAASAPIKRRKLRQTVIVPGIRPPAAAAAASNDDDEEVQVHTMADLVRDHPFIRMDSTCEQATMKLAVASLMLAPASGGSKKRARDANDPRSIAAAAAISVAELSIHKRDLDAVQASSLHFSASQADPLEFTLMQRARNRLAMPERRIDDVLHSHQDASSILRRSGRRLLPVFTAAHEANLLRVQAGTFTLPCGKRTFPPCYQGINCVGRNRNEIPGLTEPVTLMRAMSPDEFLALMKDGTQPVGVMDCVLCGRKNMEQAVMMQRHGMRPTLPPVQLEVPDSVLQLWRNLDNEPGGYFGRYILHPLPDEIVIDPIACYHPSLLTATFDKKIGSWSIHQEQMIWRPAALLPRDVVGEQRQQLSACVGCDPAEPRLEAGIPSHLCLLRLGILSSSSSSSSLVLNLDCARLLLGSLDAPAADRDVAARVVDAYPIDADAEVPLASANWSNCTSIYSLPWLGSEVADLSYNRDIATVKDPLTNLISKGLAARCQTRLAGRVIENVMFVSATDRLRYAATMSKQEDKRTIPETQHARTFRAKQDLRQVVKTIILCSLLGNYPHVSGHRLQGEARRRCYILFMGHEDGGISEETSDAWFQAMLHQAPMMVVWCLREYIVHALLDAPAVLAAVGDFIHFPDFRRITGEAMHAIRIYVQQNLPWDWSSMGSHARWALDQLASDTTVLCRCMQNCKNHRKGQARRQRVPCRYRSGDGDIRTMSSWLHDIEGLMEPFHDDILAASYHKPDAGIISFLLGSDVRVAAPLVPRPLSEEERKLIRDTSSDDAIAARMEQEEREEDDARQLLNDHLGAFVDDRGSLMATARYKAFLGDKKAHEAKEKERASVDARTSAAVFEFVHPKQFAVLRRLAEMVADLAELVPFFDGLGVDDPRVVSFIVALLQSHRDCSVSKKERMRQITLLWEREPHAYNLLQIGAELVKLAQRKRSCVVGSLSRGSYLTQIAAVRQKSLDIIQTDDQLRVASFDKNIAKFAAKARKSPADWLLPLQQLVKLRALFYERIERTAESYTGAIEESGVCLYVCTICNEVYSNVRESVGQTFYKWGLREASCNYTTGTLHCKQNCVSFQGRCSEVPLHRVNLLGIRFAWDTKAYQLCCKCGDVFVPTPDACTDWSGKGLLCCACTAVHRHRLNTDPAFDKASAFVVALDRRCAYCNESKNLDDKTFLYPFDLVLCHTHHSKTVRWHVRQSVKGVVGWHDYGQCRDRESTKAFLIRLISEKRRERRKKQMIRGVAAMKRNRQKNRQKKC